MNALLPTIIGSLLFRRDPAPSEELVSALPEVAVILI
jgi:hypothetical protein